MLLDLSREFFRWNVDAYVAYISCPMFGMLQGAIDAFGGTWPASIVTLRGHDCFWWSNKGALEENGQRLYEVHRKDFPSLRKEYDRRVRGLHEATREVMAAGEVDEKELRELWRRFFAASDRFWEAAEIWETMNYGTSALLTRALEGKKGLLQPLSQFPERSFNLEEEYQFIRQVAGLGATIGEAKRDPGFAEAVRRHQEAFAWIQDGYHGTRDSDAAFFTQRLEGVDLEEEKERLERHPERIGAAIRAAERGLDPGTKGLAAAVRLSAYMQDHRKMEGIKAIRAIEKLYRRLARLIGWELDETLCFMHDELDKLLRGDMREELRRRQRCCALLLDNKRVRVVTRGAQRMHEELDKAYFARHARKDISGIGVSPGKARGRVKVLGSMRGVKRFPKDSILVTVFTSPDYVVAMREAKAIVTDEGGITSHAAIVSRELGIPCIVGTKTATKQLKDGDLVEVDADKGVVRRA